MQHLKGKILRIQTSEGSIDFKALDDENFDNETIAATPISNSDWEKLKKLFKNDEIYIQGEFIMIVVGDGIYGIPEFRYEIVGEVDSSLRNLLDLLNRNVSNGELDAAWESAKELQRANLDGLNIDDPIRVSQTIASLHYLLAVSTQALQSVKRVNNNPNNAQGVLHQTRHQIENQINQTKRQ